MKPVAITVYHLFLSFVFFASACGADSGSSAGSQSNATIESIPDGEKWRSNMIQFGEKHWQDFHSRFQLVKGLKKIDPKWQDSDPFNHALSDCYYDFPFVLFQIGEFLGDSKWSDRAKEAIEFWRDYYVLPANGNIQGFWNFSHGLAEDYRRNKTASSKQALTLLAQNAAYARDTTPASEMIESAERSREIAYAIVAYLDAESAGAPRRPRLTTLVNHALGHVDQFIGRAKWILLPEAGRAKYVRPFMIALTARALIQYDEKVGDKRILPTLKAAADYIWDTMWRPEARAFAYTDRVVDDPNDKNPSADLNLLIAPMYGWIYSKTGEVKYLERGDEIFSGGVQQAWLAGDFAKQFNQNYLWSFDYIRWRATRTN